jgi:hypothetical protein
MCGIHILLRSLRQLCMSYTEAFAFHAIAPFLIIYSMSLNWPLSAQVDKAFFGRQIFHQNLFRKSPRYVNDDVWTFNSQCTSQWDGLRHFGYQKEQKFYNGVTMEDIHAVDEHGHRVSTVNGIQGIYSSYGIYSCNIICSNSMCWHGVRNKIRPFHMMLSRWGQSHWIIY